MGLASKDVLPAIKLRKIDYNARFWVSWGKKNAILG
jgi:hypothetical protein